MSGLTLLIIIIVIIPLILIGGTIFLFFKFILKDKSKGAEITESLKLIQEIDISLTNFEKRLNTLEDIIISNKFEDLNNR